MPCLVLALALAGVVSVTPAVRGTPAKPGPAVKHAPLAATVRGQRTGAAETATDGQAASADPATLALGQEVYRSQCQPCHGRHGKGDGPAARFIDPKPRDLTSGKWEHVREPKLEEVVRVVTEGVPDTGMEPFAELLTEEEIRAVAVYVLRHFAPAPGGDGGRR